MNDFAPLRPSRSSYVDAACWGATNEQSQGGSAGYQPSRPNDPIYSTAMTTDSPLAVDVVDFYELIDQPHNATTVQLRSRINELYAEAQVNRDHRNVEKRHQYTRLLQWIPPLRSILLHEGKRAKYDALLQSSQNGDTSIDFRTALNDLLGENDFDFGEGESILGIRDTAPTAIAEPEARLSSRLDAVAAAAGEGAARASAAASSPVFAAPTPEPAVAAYATPSNPLASASTASVSAASSNAPADTADTSRNAVADSAAPTKPAAAPTSSTRSARSEPARKAALNPALLRERASLSASAAGALVLFIVLLTLRAMLGVESNLPALVGIAFVAGFVAWRSTRRILMARIPAK